MSEVARIADELRRAYDGDPWHGPPLRKILDGISARDAAAHPIPAAHSIWEIVLHISAWIGEVQHRLRGGQPGQPDAGDWPQAPSTGEEEWERAKDGLASAHLALLRELDSTPEERLWCFVGDQARDRAEGTGVSFYVMLHGLAQHNVYHSAQIATLHRMLAGFKD